MLNKLNQGGIFAQFAAVVVGTFVVRKAYSFIASFLETGRLENNVSYEDVRFTFPKKLFLVPNLNQLDLISLPPERKGIAMLRNQLFQG